jgi:hypothetical protein
MQAQVPSQLQHRDKGKTDQRTMDKPAFACSDCTAEKQQNRYTWRFFEVGVLPWSSIHPIFLKFARLIYR